jgi:hypothetical protein
MPGGTTGQQSGPMTFTRGGPGGGTANAQLIALLKKSTTKWAAAAIGSQSASTLQLESDRAVIPIGGFSGSDPAPTTDRFKQWVSEGKIHYFVSGGGMGGGPGGGRGTGSEISTWVEANYTAITVGTETVYDLTKPKA